MEPGSEHDMGDDPRCAAATAALGTRHLVLVGLMGAGKSAIGRRLAAAMGRPFVDSDVEVERAAGCSIATVFKRDGEDAFRQMEEAALQRLLDGPPAVIATGGGAFMRRTNRKRIRSAALSVWLRADLDVLVERIRRPASRPLLAGVDLRSRLSALMRERHPVYAEADVTIDSEATPHAETVQRTLDAIAGMA